MGAIGIIGAMNEEVELYLASLKNTKETNIAGFNFASGNLSEKNVVIVKSGIGKVNAALCAQMLIHRFDVSSIIFTGVAGALNPNLNIKDIVISEDSIQHDIDAKSLGFEKGQIPFTDLRFFKADTSLINIALSAAESIGLKAMKGRILTGDQFITDQEHSISLRKEFDGDCIDMESAAVAHVCELNTTPHVIIRSISDKADHSASVDFAEFCKEAAENSFKLVSEILFKLDEPQFENKAEEFVKSKIRTIPNWPKEGVMFRDITTLLKDKEGFNHMIDLLVKRYQDKKIDVIAGIESRGFITGAVLANKLGLGFIPIRKPGKLPAETISEEYELEYGKNKIEIHKDAVEEGSKVLLVDDLIATGGTAIAACNLLKKLGAEIVECSFIVDLPDLGGKKKLQEAGYKVFNLVEFEGE